MYYIRQGNHRSLEKLFLLQDFRPRRVSLKIIDKEGRNVGVPGSRIVFASARLQLQEPEGERRSVLLIIVIFV